MQTTENMNKIEVSKQKDDKRVVFLDYLRIFAFISVLLGHKFYDHIVAFSNNTEVHFTAKLIAQLLIPLIQGTYAIYLFHNWLFDEIKLWIKEWNITIISLEIQALILLTVFCYIAVKAIEKPGIFLGKKILIKLKSRKINPPNSL